MRVLRATLLLCAVVVLTEAGRCPSGWKYRDQRCFQFFNAKVDWGTAEMRCQKLGGNLASIHSQAEDEFVRKLIRSNRNVRAWIGGSDAEKEGVWMWSDGRPMKYKGWASKQPNNWRRLQHCTVTNYKSQGRWNDQKCYRKFPAYVCSVDACMQ